MQTQERTTEVMKEGALHMTYLASTRFNLSFPEILEPGSQLDSRLSPPPAHLFKHVAQATLAERFPLITCFAISFGLLISALITEVECLKGSGYFWR